MAKAEADSTSGATRSRLGQGLTTQTQQTRIGSDAESKLTKFDFNFNKKYSFVRLDGDNNIDQPLNISQYLIDHKTNLSGTSNDLHSGEL